MENQYVIFYKYDRENEVRHYAVDMEQKETAKETMDALYVELRNYISHGVGRFTILSITKL